MSKTEEDSKLQPPFRRPDQFGRPEMWYADTRGAVQIFVVLLLVSICVWTVSILFESGEQVAGVPEVNIVQMTLDGGDPQLSTIEEPSPAMKEFWKSVPVMDLSAEVAQIENLAPVGSANLDRTKKIDTASIEQHQQKTSQSINSAVQEAIKNLQRLEKEGRLARLNGLRGMGGIFKIPDDVTSVVYVIDRSGSMSGNPIQRVKAELVAAIEGLTDDKSFYVIFYDSVAWKMYSSQGVGFTGSLSSIKMQRATRGNKDKVTNWLAEVSTGGGTNPVPAMLAAIDAEPGLIYLLSDGAFNPMSADQIIEANKRKRSGKKIHCVGLSETPIPTLLKIATECGGVYYAVSQGP